MKYFNIALLLVLLCLTHFVTSDEEGSKRTNLLLRRTNPRGPLSKTTTTTTTEAPKQYDDAIGDEEYDQGDDLDEAEKGEHGETAVSSTTTTTTSTEPPKKIGPIIRPFRSNDDLLLALKRRQMSIKKNKIEKPAPKPESESEKQETPQASPQKSTISEKSPSRRRFGGQKSSSASDVDEPANAATEEQHTTAIKRPSRFSLRTSRSN